eukprot:3549799-Pleurochrysis_carterae.AAC.2
MSRACVTRHRATAESSAVERKSKLERRLTLLTTRGAEAAMLNSDLVQTINALRADRRDFLARVRNADERDRMMMRDMRQFAATAHAALDEKEKARRAHGGWRV